jgi:hypothetical protein
VAGDTDPGVGLFPLQQFSIVSGKIPSSWIVAWNESGMLELTTRAWSRAGFWDKYVEHDPEAVLVFEQEMAKIVSEDQ